MTMGSTSSAAHCHDDTTCVCNYMKKILLIVIAILFVAVDADAQRYYVDRTVGAVEVDLNVGLATAANNMPGYGKSRQGVDAGVEVRYNFGAAPVDLGLNLSVCSMYRGQTINNVIHSYKFVSSNLLLTSDYNFYQGGNVSPFVGLGVGVAWCDKDTNGGRGTHFAVMPRVGVELSRHVRITLGYKVFDKANNHLLLSLGYAFGGGRR